MRFFIPPATKMSPLRGFYFTDRDFAALRLL
jgi:hypothetical protein